jgi:antirestriction protein ArdC
MSRSLEDIHDQLVAAIEGLVSSEQWRAMLEVSARFHNYSINNQLLIFLQCPDATRVCGYRAWQRLGRQVRKGERGIRILAPCRKRVNPVESEREQDEAERVEILTGFRVVHVFDVSQTDGAELAEIAPRRLTGEVPQQLIDALERRVADEGFVLRREAIARSSRNGYADFERHLVVIREDLSGAQAAKTLIHELAHLLLHRDSDLCDRAVVEVEAESVAFVVCSALGLDTSDYSFPYVARWGGGDAELVAATAQRVITAAGDLIASVASLRESEASVTGG